jgi:hypothetical protein
MTSATFGREVMGAALSCRGDAEEVHDRALSGDRPLSGPEAGPEGASRGCGRR